MGWANPVVDKNLEAAGKAVSVVERVQLLKTVADEFAKDLPAVPIFHYANVVLARKGLEFGSGKPFPDPLFVEEWIRAPVETHYEK